MLSRSDVLASTIEMALRDQALSMDHAGSGAWRVALSNGAPFNVLARLGDGWFELSTESPVQPDPPVTGWWPLLRLNARLRGASCLVGGPGGTLRLQGDIVADPEVDECVVTSWAEGNSTLGCRAASLCEDLRIAHDLVCGPRGSSKDVPLEDEDDQRPSTSSHDLAALCAQAGWTAVPRDDSNGIRVAIDVRSSTIHANVAVDQRGRLQAVAPLTSTPVAFMASRDAIAWLLLQLPSAVRGVKGLALIRGGDEVPAVAVTCQHGPLTAAAAGLALAALTVACELVEREVLALSDETLARHYLALQGLEPPAADQLNNHTQSRPEEMPCLQLP